MEDPFDLRLGSPIHGPEVFSRKAVQGPPTADGVRPTYVTKAVAHALRRERCLRHLRGTWLVGIGQVFNPLPPALGVDPACRLRTVVEEGVVMMAVRDFAPEPLSSALLALKAATGFSDSFRKVGFMAGNCSTPVLHVGFPVRDLIAHLRCLVELDGASAPFLAPTAHPACLTFLAWLVETFPWEARSPPVSPPRPLRGVSSPAIDPSQTVDASEPSEAVEPLEAVEPSEAMEASTAPAEPASAGWADSVPVAWSILGRRAVVDRRDLERHLVRLGFEPALLRVLGVDEGAVVDAEAFADVIGLPALAARFERVPVLRAWLVLVRLAASRVAIDEMTAEVAAFVASRPRDPDRADPAPRDPASHDPAPHGDAALDADAVLGPSASGSVH